MLYGYSLDRDSKCSLIGTVHKMGRPGRCIGIASFWGSGRDKMAVLYEQYTACDGKWTRSSLVVSLRERHSTKKRGCRKWMTFKQLCDKYQSVQAAEEIIMNKLTDEVMAKQDVKPHPDAPLNPQLTLFRVWDEEGETDEHDEVLESLFSLAQDDDMASSKHFKSRKHDKKKKRKSSSSSAKSSSSSKSSSDDSDDSSSSSASKAKKSKKKCKKSKNSKKTKKTNVQRSRERRERKTSPKKPAERRPPRHWRQKLLRRRRKKKRRHRKRRKRRSRSNASLPSKRSRPRGSRRRPKP